MCLRKAELRLMLTNLLVERFGLKFHRESKEDKGYDLVIGQGGAKLTASTPDTSESPGGTMGGALRSQALDKRGFPVISGNGFSWRQASEGGVSRVTFRQCSMDALADALSGFISDGSGMSKKVPISNKTGLTGKYDAHLEFASAPSLHPGVASPSGPAGDIAAPQPDIIAAVQRQLGLQLIPSKQMRERIVIDHVDRTPSAN